MTFSGNFMPKRFGAGQPQKPKIKTHREKPPKPTQGGARITFGPSEQGAITR